MEVEGTSVWFISKLGRGGCRKKIFNIIQVVSYWIIFRAKYLSFSKTLLFHISQGLVMGTSDAFSFIHSVSLSLER